MSEAAACETKIRLRARAQALDNLDRSNLLADPETFAKVIEWLDAAVTPVEIEGMKRILQARTPWAAERE